VREVVGLLHFGVKLQLGSILIYGARNIDDLLIGKFLGERALGLYQLAYRLMLWPLQRISRSVSSVALPVMCSIQDDKVRQARYFITLTGMIALVTFPLMVTAGVAAGPVVRLVAGSKWAAAAPVFAILSLVGLVQSISTNTGLIFVSQGRADARLKLTAVASSVVVVSFVIGLPWGIVGVAAAYAVANVVLLPVQFAVAGRIIGLRWYQPWRPLLPVFLCAVAMGLAQAGVRLWLPVRMSDWQTVVVLVGTGLPIYGVLLWCCRVGAFIEMRKHVGTFLRH
jgi:O-antigen/teichoic acid export membrane protein